MNTMPTLSRSLAQIAALAALIGLGSGCNLPVSLVQPLHEETRTSNTPHLTGEALEVVAVNGSVTVSQSDREDVQIVAHLKAIFSERLEAVKVVADRDGNGTLSISVDWPDGKPKNREGCSFEVLVRDAEGVTLRSSNGRLDLSGLGGNADLRTSNGAIEVNSHNGPLKATTSNGQIAATGIEGVIDISTSNGRIEVTDATNRVDARTSNGSVDVSLDAEGAGPIKAQTSNGSITLALSPAMKGQLTLTTSNGSVKVDSGLESHVTSRKKSRAVLDFGESENQSTAKTSNGSIRVRSR
jgi:putative adhesin